MDLFFANNLKEKIMELLFNNEKAIQSYPKINLSFFVWTDKRGKA